MLSLAGIRIMGRSERKISGTVSENLRMSRQRARKRRRERKTETQRNRKKDTETDNCL